MVHLVTLGMFAPPVIEDYSGIIGGSGGGVEKRKPVVIIERVKIDSIMVDIKVKLLRDKK